MNNIEGELLAITNNVNNIQQQLSYAYRNASKEWSDRLYDNFYTTAVQQIEKSGESFTQYLENAAYEMGDAINRMEAAMGQL